MNAGRIRNSNASRNDERIPAPEQLDNMRLSALSLLCSLLHVVRCLPLGSRTQRCTLDGAREILDCEQYCGIYYIVGDDRGRVLCAKTDCEKINLRSDGCVTSIPTEVSLTVENTVTLCCCTNGLCDGRHAESLNNISYSDLEKNLDNITTVSITAITEIASTVEYEISTTNSYSSDDVEMTTVTDNPTETTMESFTNEAETSIHIDGSLPSDYPSDLTTEFSDITDFASSSSSPKAMESTGFSEFASTLELESTSIAEESISTEVPDIKSSPTDDNVGTSATYGTDISEVSTTSHIVKSSVSTTTDDYYDYSDSTVTTDRTNSKEATDSSSETSSTIESAAFTDIYSDTEGETITLQSQSTDITNIIDDNSTTTSAPESTTVDCDDPIRIKRQGILNEYGCTINPIGETSVTELQETTTNEETGNTERTAQTWICDTGVRLNVSRLPNKHFVINFKGDGNCDNFS